MKSRHLYRSSLALFVFICVTLNFLGEQNVDAQKLGQHVSNEVLVRFKEGIDESTKESIRENLGATLVKTIKSIRVEHWKLPEDVTVEDALVFLNNTQEVEYSEPNILYKPQSLPNDPNFNKLWFLRNTGQTVNGKIGLAGRC